MNIHEIYRLIEGISLTQFSGAGVVFLTKNGSVLMLKKQNGVWGMPGGKPIGDELPEETAVRESEEETGIEAKDLENPLIIYYKDRKYFSYFNVLGFEKNIKLSKEHSDFKWVYYKNIHKLKLSHFIKNNLNSYISRIEELLD